MKISKYQKLFGVGPLGIIFSLVLLGLLWLIDRAFDHVEILNDSRMLSLIGLILITLWICWHIWCMKTIRSWWSHDQLCTKGPYRFVRHPIYSGGIWIGGIGIALLFNSWVILLWPLLAYPLWSILVRKEEKMMIRVFGETYKLYASHTGRLFPKCFS